MNLSHSEIASQVLAEMEENSANKFVLITGKVYIRQAILRALEKYDALRELEAKQ